MISENLVVIPLTDSKNSAERNPKKRKRDEANLPLENDYMQDLDD
jgi:hypothetical protein